MFDEGSASLNTDDGLQALRIHIDTNDLIK